MPGLDIEPYYFGTDDELLFGCYSPPRSAASRPCGVILCYPMGQEYIRSHRTYRQLATRLSNAGFPVLRFDFSGCGDSRGDHEEGRIDHWLTDLSTAIGELRRRCGPVKICLAGLRLGGTLSMLQGAERGDIDGLVLWDPVLNGRAYVEELMAWDHAEGRPPETTPRDAEVLGFPLTDLLREDLEGIDLLSTRRRPAQHVLIVDSDDDGGQGQLSELLERLGVGVEYEHLPGPKIWIKTNKTVVPHQVLQCVASWIARVYP